MDNLSTRFGNVTNKLGELIEYLVAPNLRVQFDVYGFNFQNLYTRVEIIGAKRNRLAELDIVLTDGDSIMSIEVKTQPTIDDLLFHLKRKEKIQMQNTGIFRNIDKVYMTIAGAIFSEEVIKEAFRLGFYVVRQKENNVEIVPPPEDFVPQYWKMNKAN